MVGGLRRNEKWKLQQNPTKNIVLEERCLCLCSRPSARNERRLLFVRSCRRVSRADKFKPYPYIMCTRYIEFDRITQWFLIQNEL